MIYVPDSGAIESGIMDFIWNDENKDIEFIKDWLLTRCGPPNRIIKDIYQQSKDSWTSKGYYIDDFKDFE
ncbi:hypothetical protein [Paenibacillus sp. PL2-23]|uniref:hypothetical protein n=1 Tax=Paenibacillus sp. PL2-23 TaxID=2100729 RepID=UPI0030FC39AF